MVLDGGNEVLAARRSDEGRTVARVCGVDRGPLREDHNCCCAAQLYVQSLVGCICQDFKVSGSKTITRAFSKSSSVAVSSSSAALVDKKWDGQRDSECHQMSILDMAVEDAHQLVAAVELRNCKSVLAGGWSPLVTFLANHAVPNAQFTVGHAWADGLQVCLLRHVAMTVCLCLDCVLKICTVLIIEDSLRPLAGLLFTLIRNLLFPLFVFFAHLCFLPLCLLGILFVGLSFFKVLRLLLGRLCWLYWVFLFPGLLPAGARAPCSSIRRPCCGEGRLPGLE